MAENLEVPKSRADSETDAEICQEGSTLSVKKSTMDAELLLMRLAGKKKVEVDL